MRVYLAGPEVFLPNARAVLDAKIELTRRHGFIPVSPGDLEIPAQPTKRAFGLAISAVNEKLMLSADAIIANLTPFRGIAADTGTVYELGFMCARGCPAFAFSNVAQSHFERLQIYYDGRIADDAQGRPRGSDGLAVEDFDMAENLMLDGGIEARGGTFVTRSAAPGRLFEDLAAFEECLRIAAGRLLQGGKPSSSS
ncbi:nucleoside 2-deoxyribosyltransferase [Labrys sp. WJW]|uniref:nucleoside 2-deoxyribosyltransferase n=1 Tax=Labrys sp. WJW TaxID=1737983 RepID=UPI00082C7421|nr:nucleoside 2-deoxyribosyltransferase [Labrys sp. WJW]OCC02233.1 nucleoside 2-deoxyribosyltransferase [Labrys sp. WJW]